MMTSGLKFFFHADALQRPGASLKYGTCVYRRYMRGKAIRRYTANISISKTICSVLHSGDV